MDKETIRLMRRAKACFRVKPYPKLTDDLDKWLEKHDVPELLACPGPDCKMNAPRCLIGGVGVYRFYCDTCHASTLGAFARARAAKLWNEMVKAYDAR